MLALAFFAASVPAQVQGQWHIETIDGGSKEKAGRSASLVIDQQGNFHLAYIHELREFQHVVRYAFRGAYEKQWHKMDLEGAGGHTSLAVDSVGRPHLAYLGPSERGLRYAFWDGSKWHMQAIDTQWTAFFMTIQIDPKDHPHISYYLFINPDGTNALRLKYAHFDGQTWFTETVDGGGGRGKFNSLALDAQGHPHISYSDVSKFSLCYAHWDGSQWNYSTPDNQLLNGGLVGLGSSIAIDSSGQPHIGYFAPGNHRVKYARRQGKTWNIEVVDVIVGRADNIDRVSLKLDRQGRPHIAYYDSGLAALKYAHRTDQGWHIEVVDQDGNPGLQPSLCFNSLNEPYIAYYDQVSGSLRLAHRASTATTSHPANKDAQP